MKYLRNPPPLAKLTALLLLAVLATPAGAQVLPEISLRINPGYAITNESLVAGCDISNGLPVQIQASSNANGVAVNIFAHTVSGHDRFRDYGVPAYIDPGQRNKKIYRSRTQVTSPTTLWAELNSFGGTGSPCFADDLLITGSSVVRVILMPGTGYTVNPNMRSVDITVRDTPGENCASAAGAPGGKYYMPHPQGGLKWGVCTCAAKSLHPSVRRALDRTVPTPGDDGRYGTDDDGTAPAPEPSTEFLSNLGRQYHDPSYLYCEESPYKGIGS